jgi:4-hydroxy-3-polyprenylbenzoate decarboxylase
MQRRIVVGICGASGVQYGIELLRALRPLPIETHLVLSRWADVVIAEECGVGVDAVCELADVVHPNDNLAASIASSSFLVEGMVVIPASVKTLAEIAGGSAGSLIARAADNMLKTRRRLVICLRETPLSLPCIENMRRITLAGGIVAPLSPGFYHHPESLADLYRFMVGKVLDLLAIDNQQFQRWGE